MLIGYYYDIIKSLTLLTSIYTLAKMLQYTAHYYANSQWVHQVNIMCIGKMSQCQFEQPLNEENPMKLVLKWITCKYFEIRIPVVWVKAKQVCCSDGR